MSLFVWPPISLSASPISFIRDLVSTQVLDDTVTPANNRPLPVKLSGITGDINITANDLNVSLDHTNDSVSLGDGTVLFTAGQKTSANSIPVVLSSEQEAFIDGIEALLTSLDAVDYATETTLTALNAKFNSLGQKASAASIPVVLSTEQEAFIDGIETLLTSIDGKDYSTETTLAALNAKFASLGQKASAGSVPVVLSTEQEAMIDGIETSLTSIDGKDFSTETTLAAASAKLPATLGQKANAASLAVTLSTEQEAMIDGIETTLTSIDGKDFSTETTLAAQSAKLPATLGQKTKAASLAVTIASDQDSVNTNLTPVDFMDNGLVDASSTSIPTASNLAIVAATAATIRKIQVIEDIGNFMTLRNAANTILAYLPLGGGEVEVNIAAGTTLGLRSETGADIVAGKIAINFLG
jgi:hypothetical protein